MQSRAQRRQYGEPVERLSLSVRYGQRHTRGLETELVSVTRSALQVRSPRVHVPLRSSRVPSGCPNWNGQPVLEESFVIVEHRFYRGSRAPHVFVVDNFDDLRTYLQSETCPGDSMWFWRYDELCRDDNPITQGKVPDQRGLVPEGGAY
jgi:hypothetical protein